MPWEPRWDVDLIYGEAHEKHVLAMLGLPACQIEVKADRRYVETGNLFIEVAQLPRGAAAYKPSGINVTEAGFWAFTFGSACTILPTQVIRDMVACQNKPPIDGGLNGDNPTKGYALSHRALITQTYKYGLAP